MRAEYITNVRLLFPGDKIQDGNLLIQEGRIAALNLPQAPLETKVTDGKGRLLTPGLIDVHTHGIHRFFYHYDTPPEHFAGGSQTLPAYGTTCIFPTVVPGNEPDLALKLGRLPQDFRHPDGACMPGLHLEGPFVALGGA